MLFIKCLMTGFEFERFLLIGRNLASWSKFARKVISRYKIIISRYKINRDSRVQGCNCNRGVAPTACQKCFFRIATNAVKRREKKRVNCAMGFKERSQWVGCWAWERQSLLSGLLWVGSISKLIVLSRDLDYESSCFSSKLCNLSESPCKSQRRTRIQINSWLGWNLKQKVHLATPKRPH